MARTSWRTRLAGHKLLLRTVIRLLTFFKAFIFHQICFPLVWKRRNQNIEPITFLSHGGDCIVISLRFDAAEVRIIAYSTQMKAVFVAFFANKVHAILLLYFCQILKNIYIFSHLTKIDFGSRKREYFWLRIIWFVSGMYGACCELPKLCVAHRKNIQPQI